MRLLNTGVVLLGLVLGATIPLFRSPNPEVWSGIKFFTFTFLSAAMGLAVFLKGTKMPVDALFDVQAERRLNPHGLATRAMLLPSWELLVAMALALLVAAAGQYLRNRLGYAAGEPLLLLALGVGFSASAVVTRIWFKPGASTPGNSLERSRDR